MIKVVLVNLLSNAIKFTPKGGKINLVITSDDENAKISIIDSGVGIKEQHIQTIFGIDKKYKTMGTNGEEGSGLGLIVCQEFILRHGGKIGVESEPEKGTHFFFTVPLDSN
jgi:signal transduction histidine kinase